MKRAPNMFDLTPPADDADGVDVMRWMIAVMDRNDKSLMFVASVLSHCIKNSGMTERQAASVEKVYARLLDQFGRGVLAIQGGGLAEDDGPTNVTHLRPRKGAA